eukprot:Platyproteum_vivax@DN11402_c0_g1_i1.p1
MGSSVSVDCTPCELEALTAGFMPDERNAPDFLYSDNIKVWKFESLNKRPCNSSQVLVNKTGEYSWNPSQYCSYVVLHLKNTPKSDATTPNSLDSVFMQRLQIRLVLRDLLAQFMLVSEGTYYSLANNKITEYNRHHQLFTDNTVCNCHESTGCNSHYIVYVCHGSQSTPTIKAHAHFKAAELSRLIKNNTLPISDLSRCFKPILPTIQPPEDSKSNSENETSQETSKNKNISTSEPLKSNKSKKGHKDSPPREKDQHRMHTKHPKERPLRTFGGRCSAGCRSKRCYNGSNGFCFSNGFPNGFSTVHTDLPWSNLCSLSAVGIHSGTFLEWDGGRLECTCSLEDERNNEANECKKNGLAGGSNRGCPTPPQTHYVSVPTQAHRSPDTNIRNVLPHSPLVRSRHVQPI